MSRTILFDKHETAKLISLNVLNVSISYLVANSYKGIKGVEMINLDDVAYANVQGLSFSVQLLSISDIRLSILDKARNNKQNDQTNGKSSDNGYCLQIAHAAL